MLAKTTSAVRFVGGMALLFSASLSAQPQPRPEPSQNAVFVVGNGAAVMPLGGSVDIIAGEGSVMGEVVVDKPYSGESITESTQILSDGNRITRTNRARLYRDSQGRTRREHVLDGIGAWQTAGEPVSMVMINDPVEDVSYFLDPRAQTARELKPFKVEAMPLPADGGAPPQGPNIAMRRWVRGVPAEAGAAVEAESYVDHFEVALPPPGELPIMTSAPIAFGTFASFGGASAAAATEDLGEQVLEGVLARGTRQTHTIPAGTIGNELPIEIVQEQWYSEDIEAIVLRRNFDPRFGETTYQLINVDRSEPPPELFAIPQDYEVQSGQAAAFRGRRLSGGPAPAPLPRTSGQRVERRVFLVQPDAQPSEATSAESQ